MSGTRSVAALAALCMIAAGGQAGHAAEPAQTESAKAGPTLEDYGRLPSVSKVTISPDGSKLAMLVGGQLQIRETQTHKPLFGMPAGETKVRGLQWAGEHHLLIITSTTAEARGVEGPKREWSIGADLNLQTHKVKQLLEFTEGGMNTISSDPIVLQIKGKPTIFVEGIYFENQMGHLALYRIDLEKGWTERIEDGNPFTQGFVVGPDGRAVARQDYDSRSGHWWLHVRIKDAWKEVDSEIAPLDHPYVMGLGRDGQSVLVEKKTGDVWAKYEVSLKDGTWSKPIEEFADLNVVEDPLTRTPIGVEHRNMEHTVYHFLSPHDQATWDAVAKAFPKEQVELESWSDDRRHIVVRVEGDRDGASYFVVDLTGEKGAAAWLAGEYRGVEPEDVAEKRVITYKAADGFEVPAYLTVPKGRPDKGLPLVVLVHGGPAARDDPGFDWWPQALASRGYAVLQPQYRGSNGFGDAHLQAGYGQWGRKMQTDLSDGVRFLTKSGEIDPKRVCIMGASYGGYAALAGAVFDPQPYRCAVSVAGPSDLRRMLAWEEDTSTKETIRYWDRFMGAKTRRDPALDDISPALHADKAGMPVLLIHGQDDTVVAYEQSKVMESALKRAGKPVEFVTLKNEDHWLSGSDTRLQMLSAAVAFLEKHNPADAPPKTAATEPAAGAEAAGSTR